MSQIMLGNVRHQLDDKNRMRIPAKYRQALGTPSYVLPGRIVDGEKCCLYVFPEATFVSDIMPKMKPSSYYGSDELADTSSGLLGLAAELEEDPQGRVKLDSNLMTSAGIDKDVVFVGKVDYLEIWSAEIWDKRYGVLNSDNLKKVLDNLKKLGV